MQLDTTFGNTAVLMIEAELDNPHERTNNVLLRDMAKMLANGITQIRFQSEQALAEAESRARGRVEPGEQTNAERELGDERPEEEKQA